MRQHGQLHGEHFQRTGFRIDISDKDKCHRKRRQQIRSARNILTNLNTAQEFLLEIIMPHLLKYPSFQAFLFAIRKLSFSGKMQVFQKFNPTLDLNKTQIMMTDQRICRSSGRLFPANMPKSFHLIKVYNRRMLYTCTRMTYAGLMQITDRTGIVSNTA